jgi:hypothetical protein
MKAITVLASGDYVVARVRRRGSSSCIAVIVEPLSVAENRVIQAFATQRRLKVRQPRKAAVVGGGTILVCSRQ